MAISSNWYNNIYQDDYGRQSLKEEYEYKKLLSMAQASPPQEEPKPEKPKHLNQKLLLTKG